MVSGLLFIPPFLLQCSMEYNVSDSIFVIDLFPFLPAKVLSPASFPVVLLETTSAQLVTPPSYLRLLHSATYSVM